MNCVLGFEIPLLGFIKGKSGAVFSVQFLLWLQNVKLMKHVGRTYKRKEVRRADILNVKYKRKERCSTNGYCQTFSSKALELSLPIADPQKKNTLEVETNVVLVHQCTSFLKWLASLSLTWTIFHPHC